MQQQQHVPQQPVRLQPDPLMMFLQQQSQQNAMMKQMVQMTTAEVQALNLQVRVLVEFLRLVLAEVSFPDEGDWGSLRGSLWRSVGTQ